MLFRFTDRLANFLDAKEIGQWGQPGASEAQKGEEVFGLRADIGQDFADDVTDSGWSASRLDVRHLVLQRGETQAALGELALGVHFGPAVPKRFVFANFR